MENYPEQLIADGMLQPVYDYGKMIREIVYVETPVDTDGDGKRDLVKVWVKRPAEPEGKYRIPALLQISPYIGGMVKTEQYDALCYHYIRDYPAPDTENQDDHPTDYGRMREVQKELPPCRIPQRMAKPEEVETYGDGFENGGPYLTSGESFDYWAVRGIASVNAGVLGTRGSEGFLSVGSKEEVQACCAVVDWLCGRAKAFTNRTECLEVRADWCSGAVAMSGQSYKGTTPIAAAMTGVEGLKTIVPIAGISSWYNAYRSHGAMCGAIPFPGEEPAVIATCCNTREIPEELQETFSEHLKRLEQGADPATGDYNAFWDERNYLRDPSKLKAAVFIIQGLNDFNVKPGQAVCLWEACRKQGVPVKLLLHQGEHITPYNISGIPYYEMLNRWYAHFLYGADNGVPEIIPPVQVQSNLNQDRLIQQDDWPMPGSRELSLYPQENGALTRIPGTGEGRFTSDIAVTGFEPAPGAANFPECWKAALVGESKGIADTVRLRFLSDPLPTNLRVSGRASVTVRACADAPTGILTAILAEFGERDRIAMSGVKIIDGHVSFQKSVTVEKKDGIEFGGNRGQEDLLRFLTETTPYKMITRGWMDIQNRENERKISRIQPGETYSFSFTLEPTDYTFSADCRIGLILTSVDVEATAWPKAITRFTVDYSGTELVLPVSPSEDDSWLSSLS